MKYFVLSIFFFALFLPSVGLAKMMEQGNGTRFASEEITAAIQEILNAQNIQSVDEISCDAVTNEQSEKLGDAVMDAMVGNAQQHELMDQMMGGEGSQSLKAAHIMMGRQYLGCWSSGYGMMMPMMGGMMGGYGTSGMMGNWGNYGMMGGGTGSWIGLWSWLGFLAMIVWLVVGILLIVWLLQKIRKNK